MPHEPVPNYLGKRGGQCPGVCTRIHSRLDRDGIGAYTHIRKDEAEGVCTGGLQNELRGQVKAARSARGDSAAAERLAERLNSGVQHNAVAAAGARHQLATKDIGCAGLERIGNDQVAILVI